MNTEIQDTMREIRKEFFAFRNGIVADTLRKAGDPHSIIMGCLLADVNAIAKRAREAISDDRQLAAVAAELWSDTNSRECRLAAPMLYPARLMSQQLALEWVQSVETTDIADNLCHKLLRHIDGADALFRQLIADEKPLVKYTGYRLLQGLLLLGKTQLNPSLRIVVENEAEQAPKPLKIILQDILEEEE